MGSDHLDAVQADLDLVTRGREGYEDFLLTFIAREEDRYGADTVDDTHHDSVRDVPLCTCDDLGCELKHGRLPLAVRDADDLGRGIREFKQEHNGDPLVLDHDGTPGGLGRPGARSVLASGGCSDGWIRTSRKSRRASRSWTPTPTRRRPLLLEVTDHVR